jgi:hypothetical protein
MVPLDEEQENVQKKTYEISGCHYSYIIAFRFDPDRLQQSDSHPFPSPCDSDRGSTNAQVNPARLLAR